MHGILDELRSALRSLLHSPLFTLVAISSLALGIGANSAIFSLIDQVILQKLPVQEPAQLVQIYQTGSHYGSNSGPRMNSYPMFKDFRANTSVHQGMFCRREFSVSISHQGIAERSNGELVSGNYFDVLGVKAHLGRLFNDEDDKSKNGHPVAVLGYDFWKTRFGGNPAIVGQDVLVNNNRLRIVGVSERAFYGLDPTRTVSVRVPMAMKPNLMAGWDQMEDRRSRFVQIFARLKPGVSVEQARAQMRTQFAAMRKMEVTEEAFAKAAPEIKAEFLRGTLELEAAANGYSGLRRQMSQPLWILMGIVGLVLLIACTNVANLLIAKSTLRRKEYAVRAALGASRWRLMRPLLVESLLLSTLGGAAGLILAFGLNSLLLGFLPTGTTPIRLTASPDWTVLAFTFAVASATGMVFGLFPALSAGRTDAAPALKEEGRGMSTGSSNLVRKSLVGVQVALSILLLIAAGLFIKTLRNLKLTNTGLNASQLITFQMDPASNGYDATKIKQFSRDLIQRAGALPGVEKVAVATVAKMAGNEWDSTVTVEGYKHDPSKMPGPYMDAVTPGYVETMGMRILQGRDFRESDYNADPFDPRKVGDSWKVCLINKKFADAYFAGRNPIGYHIGMGGNPDTKTTIEIVGVFSDAKYMNVRDEVPIQMLVPLYQTGYPFGMVVYARARGAEQALFPQLRSLVRGMDAMLPVYAMRSFDEQMESILATERLLSFLAAIFGVIATILAAIGLYGVLALAVSRRTKEIGIRIALGAESRSVIGLVMREVVFLVIGGAVAGVPAAIALSEYVKSQLYGMEATDPSTFALAVAALVLVAILAAWLPTLRATRVNPIEVLRYD
jgi:predicted permease